MSAGVMRFRYKFSKVLCIYGLLYSNALAHSILRTCGSGQIPTKEIFFKKKSVWLRTDPNDEEL
jgi:hypothetical protein